MTEETYCEATKIYYEIMEIKKLIHICRTDEDFQLIVRTYSSTDEGFIPKRFRKLILDYAECEITRLEKQLADL